MTLRKILIEPNPILRQVSEPVSKVGEEERKFIRKNYNISIRKKTNKDL